MVYYFNQLHKHFVIGLASIIWLLFPEGILKLDSLVASPPFICIYLKNYVDLHNRNIILKMISNYIL